MRPVAIILASFFIASRTAPEAAQSTPDAAANAQQAPRPAATAPQQSPTQSFSVAPGNWVDTGIMVSPGTILQISAEGVVRDTRGRSVDSAGSARRWTDLIRSLLANDAGIGALIGRIGDDSAAVPFVIGANKQISSQAGGHLFLAVNDVVNGQAELDAGGGAYTVQVAGVGPGAGNGIQASDSPDIPQPGSSRKLAKNALPPTVTQPGSDAGGANNRVASQGAEVDPKLLKNTEQMLNSIPRRVTDQSGNPGDAINFVMIGSQEQMESAMQTAGWIIVDRDTTQAAIHAILSTLQRKAYTEVPMSELYLFGRPQDFGFARAEPVAVITTRNHLRIWNAGKSLDGQTVWVGAATHDIGLERDQRNGNLTHSIDPDVDKERDFLRLSLTDAGIVAKSGYATPKHPVQEARTATGGSFHSDGRVLVLELKQGN